MPRVKIDERFWTGVLNDYSNWSFAWVREAGQNSLDAGAKNINFFATYDKATDETKLLWSDDGCGMTREILENKFLALGASLKLAKGSTGGFGVAKQLLAFAHKRYSIRTRNLVLTGSHDEYEIVEVAEDYKGTMLTVYIAGDRAAGFQRNIFSWAELSTTDATIYFNGNKVPTCIPLGKAKASLPWCDIFVHADSPPNRLNVRINGQMMFSRYIDNVSKGLIADIIDTDSTKYFTSNRDGMVYHFANELDRLISTIFRDPNKIVEANEERITFYDGALGKLNSKRSIVAAGNNRAAAFAPNQPDGEPAPRRGEIIPNNLHIGVSTEKPEQRKFALSGYDFAVVNSTTKDTPEAWLPENMSEAKWAVLNRWNAIIEVCMNILGREENVTTGWIFSTRALAMHKVGPRGTMILINPIQVTGNKMVSRWNNSRESFFSMVATAVHEITHCDWQYHDEEYAAALTRNMAKVLANASKLALVK